MINRGEREGFASDTPLNQLLSISNEDYHAHPAISRSQLIELRKSPAHFYEKYLNPNREIEKKQSKEIELGIAVHCYILEPDLFKQNYVCAPPEITYEYKGTTREGKAERLEYQKIYDDFVSKNVGKKILDAKSYETVLNIGDSLFSYQTAKNLIDGGQFEKTIFWENKEVGVMCKCRPDIFFKNMICDLKTTHDASYPIFQRAVLNYGYHIQAAMIQEACDVAGFEINNFIYIVVETEPPHAIAIYPLSQSALVKGKTEFYQLLRVYKKCLEKNEWSREYQIRELFLPNYA